MGRRRRIAVAGIAVAGMAGGLALGLVPDDVPTPGDLGKPVRAAAAPGLATFEDCEALRRWYVDQALPQVTAYGLGGGLVYPLAERAMAAEAADGAAVTDAVGNGATGTNVQEVGVDEPDLAKTDGSVVYRLVDRRLVVTDVTGAEPERVAALRLPPETYGAELLLVGDHLQVVAQAGSAYDPAATVDRVAPDGLVGPGGGSSTRVIDVDVTDPSAPRLGTDRTFDGQLVSARQHGDVVRLVLSDPVPDIAFVSPYDRFARPGRDRGDRPTRAEALAENRRLVREAPVGAWLPSVSTDGGGSEALVACGDVLHPEQDAGLGTLAVVGYDVASPADLRTTALTASGELAYSSGDQLVVATARWGWAWGARLRGRDAEGPETSLHVFDLDGTDATWAASGGFDGGLKDRWSIDAVDGRVRVAAGVGYRGWTPEENAVLSFARDGRRLVETGRADGLGVGEEIMSVRWFDDLAIVVTFVQTDPLYTVDVAGPEPRTLGEVTLPGFSAYLHPVGDERLLGLGTATRLVDEGGRPMARPTGAKASVFDVSDLAAPSELSTARLERSTSFASDGDPRTVTWLPDRSVGLVATDSYGGRGQPSAYVTVVRVSPDGDVTLEKGPDVPGFQSYATRSLPLADGRVAVVTPRSVQLLDLG